MGGDSQLRTSNRHTPVTVPRDSYYTAAVCLCGHPLTEYVEDMQAMVGEYCGQCGERVITACPECEAPVRGHYRPPAGYLSVCREYVPPNYCHNCGEAYPWTEQALKEARELIESDPNLDESDKSALAESLLPLTKDTPQTAGAILRFKGAMGKLSEDTRRALVTVLVTVATDCARRELNL
jgi:hypothetical protein